MKKLHEIKSHADRIAAHGTGVPINHGDEFEAEVKELRELVAALEEMTRPVINHYNVTYAMPIPDGYTFSQVGQTCVVEPILANKCSVKDHSDQPIPSQLAIKNAERYDAILKLLGVYGGYWQIQLRPIVWPDVNNHLSVIQDFEKQLDDHMAAKSDRSKNNK